MKISKQWLLQGCSKEISTNDLVNVLTNAGLEVDAVEKVAPEFNNIVTGVVKTCVKHPDATKLSVCTVDVGTGEILDIVCGAANVREGLKVAVAKVGCKLSPTFEIKPSEIRGVASNGMLCSEEELGTAVKSDGILELDQDIDIGLCIRDVLHLNDEIIEIDLTPNRGDCLSLLGLRQELVANLDVTFENTVNPSADLSTLEESSSLTIDLKASEACPQYFAAQIQGVDNSKPVPLWLKERLRRSGIASNNLIADITNLVMLETGQPLHAFDASTIGDVITVRYGNNEKVTLLDASEIEVMPNTLVIANESNVLALAGVMGCDSSKVTESTHSVVLEAAHFDPIVIAGKTRDYNVVSDAAYRFERGVDSEITCSAFARAIYLIQTLATDSDHASETFVASSVVKDYLPNLKQIAIEANDINSVLGTSLDLSQITDIFTRLNFKISKQSDTLLIEVPVRRFDITIKEDLIEEIARLIGYDKLPRAIYQSVANASADGVSNYKSDADTTYDLVYSIKQRCASLGLSEVVNYSFIDQTENALFCESEAVTLLNPISSDLSVMRSSLIPGLIKNIKTNLSRQKNNIQIFEIGNCFSGSLSQVTQDLNIAGLLYDNGNAPLWKGSSAVDFYSAKAILEEIALILNVYIECDAYVDHEIYHPGQCAKITVKASKEDVGIEAGYIGRVHPKFAETCSVPSDTYMFELKLEAVQDHLKDAKVASVQCPLPSKMPEVERDLAFLLSKNITYNQCLQVINGVSRDHSICSVLKDVNLFDVYTGENVPSDSKSLAFRFRFQSEDKTLTDVDIDPYLQAIIKAMGEHYSAQLR